jgi:hypothetical protein
MSVKPTIPHAPDQRVADLAEGLKFENPQADAVLEDLRLRLAPDFGVTLMGPFLTLRWKDGRHHVEATFQCVSLTHTRHLTEHDPEYNK